MPNYCKLILAGHLGKDPELTYGRGGNPVCEFSVAWNSGKKGEGKPTAWFDVVAFGDRAEQIANGYKKGDGIQIVNAIPKPEVWEKNGKKHGRLKWIVWEVDEIRREREPGGDDGPAAAYPDDRDVPY